MFRVETDRRPGHQIFFGSLEDTVAGLEVHGRVRMKPRMLRIAPDHLIRVDAEEVLYLEEENGQTTWVTLRGRFVDLDNPTMSEALAKASKSGVFLQISKHYAIAPSRIMGIRLRRHGHHLVEVEGPSGGIVELPMSPDRLQYIEDCLEAINLGGGFLVTGPEEA